jgi:predicted dehydrogenase
MSARDQCAPVLERSYAGIEEMLRLSNLDIVAVAVPPAAQLAIIERLRGLPVHQVYEKPIGFVPGSYHALARSAEVDPHHGIALVNQYRFAPGWQALEEWIAQAPADRSRPLNVVVDIRRPRPDPLARMDWRSAPESGGLIADHGSHFVALTRRLTSLSSVLWARRSAARNGSEVSLATVALQGGALSMHLRWGASERSTTVSVSCPDRSAIWSDTRLKLARPGRADVRTLVVAPLSDRQVIDRLYLPWYRAVLEGFEDRRHMDALRAEALDVAKVMCALGESLGRAEGGAVVVQ